MQEQQEDDVEKVFQKFIDNVTLFIYILKICI